MRRFMCLALSAALLSACGQVPPVGARAAASTALRAHGARADLAQEFEMRMKAHFTGVVSREGAKVKFASPGQPASVYDFTNAAKAGTVKVTIGEFETTVTLAQLMQDAPDSDNSEILPALLVPIALDMAAAGAQALMIYWLGHRGDEFDKSDATKAVALAMALALVPFLGEMSGLAHILPIAAKLVAACPTFVLRDVMRAAAAMSGEIIDLVRFLIKLRKANKPADAVA